MKLIIINTAILILQFSYSWSATITVLNLNNASRIFYVSNAEITFNRLTLTNGVDNSNAYKGGSAVASYQSGDITINNSLSSSYSRGAAVDIANYNPVSKAGGTTAKRLRFHIVNLILTEYKAHQTP